MSAATPQELERLVGSYVDDVLDGRVVAGKLVRLAVERHVQDLENGGDRGLVFDWRRAQHALRFASGYVRHTKGEWAGRPLVLEPWEAFWLASIFGWTREVPEGRARRFRSVYTSMGRKNAKTFLAAVTGLYCLLADNEPGAEVYSAATKRDQALLCWSQAAEIVRLDPALRRRVKVLPSRGNMSVKSTASKFQALGRDHDTLDGLNAHCAIVDELHAHKTRDTWDVLESSMGARREPLILGITTAGSMRKGLCWDLDHDGARLLEGLIENDSSFAFIARLDEGDDWADEAAWPKANPNLGISVKPEKLQIAAQQAKNNAAYLNEFRRKHCNEWTEAHTAWLPLDAWNACDAAVDPEALAGRPCYAGLDLSSTKDVTALVLAFPSDDGHMDILPFFWIPEATIPERVRTDRVPFDVWVERGYVEATDGNVVDQDAIKQRLVELRERYDIREVPMDPYNGWKLATELQGLGLEVVQFRQGWASMSPAMKETEQLILSRKLRHGGHPVLRWMFTNVSVKTDPAGNIKPDKERSADRIDGIVALIMAAGRAAVYVDQGGFSWVLGRDD